MEEWGEARKEESYGEGQDTARGFPHRRDSLLHMVGAVNMETLAYRFCRNINIFLLKVKQVICSNFFVYSIIKVTNCEIHKICNDTYDK